MHDEETLYALNDHLKRSLIGQHREFDRIHEKCMLQKWCSRIYKKSERFGAFPYSVILAGFPGRVPDDPERLEGLCHCN